MTLYTRILARSPHCASSHHGRRLLHHLVVGLAALVVLVGLPLHGSRPAEAATRTFDLVASQMTFVRQSTPTQNYGASTYLTVSNAEYRTLLAFDTSSLPTGSTVTAASLSLNVGTSTATKPGFAVYSATTGWTAGTVTWSTRPTESKLLSSDTSVAQASTPTTLALPNLNGDQLDTTTAFSLAYTAGSTQVFMSKTSAPVLHVSVNAPAVDKTYDLSTTAATFTAKSAPTTNYGNFPYVKSSNGEYRSYLKFDTSQIPAGQVILSASLDTTVQTSNTTAPALDIHTTSTGWDAATLTSGNAPTADPLQLNDTDATIATTGKAQKSALPGLWGVTPGPAMAFQIGYVQAGGTAVQLLKSPKPVLHLTVRDKSDMPANPPAAAPIPNPFSTLPYAPAAAGSSTKKVFAHYFPPFPISIDNVPAASDYYTRNYLDPAGQGGQYASVGGLLRDRPMPRDPVGGDYRMKDAKTDITQAADSGIDGFLTDIMGFDSGPASSWTQSLRVSQAAGDLNNGFVVTPNLDMTASAVTSLSPSAVADYLAQFYATSGAYKLPDGRYMLTAFYAEAKPASYYAAIESALSSSYHIDVAFVGVFLSLTDAQIVSYSPVSYGVGIWGPRTVLQATMFPNRAATAHANGLKWMAPVVVQDVRAKSASFAENGNTELLRTTWGRAISDGSDMAQVVTWNDYSESSAFNPSQAHGYSWLDLSGYYATWFKNGTAPTLTGDELIVSHRTQSVTTIPTVQTTTLSPNLAGATTTPRDTAEVVCLCRSGASVQLTSGSGSTTYNASAGVSAQTLPLQTGQVSATATRSDATVASVTSPFPVLSTVKYWDLQYYAATSRSS